MIVGDEFRNPAPQRIFTKPNHPIETRFLNRSHEAFGVGVAESRRLQIVWETRRGGSE
jgi:hypothetical protein